MKNQTFYYSFINQSINQLHNSIPSKKPNISQKIKGGQKVPKTLQMKKLKETHFKL